MPPTALRGASDLLYLFFTGEEPGDPGAGFRVACGVDGIYECGTSDEEKRKRRWDQLEVPEISGGRGRTCVSRVTYLINAQNSTQSPPTESARRPSPACWGRKIVCTDQSSHPPQLHSQYSDRRASLAISLAVEMRSRGWVGCGRGCATFCLKLAARL